MNLEIEIETDVVFAPVTFMRVNRGICDPPEYYGDSPADCFKQFADDLALGEVVLDE